MVSIAFAAFAVSLSSRWRSGLCITGWMPFHNPISNYERGQQPDPRSGSGSGSGSGRKQSGGMKSLVQAEKLLQIAFILPCAMVVGWAMGWGVDHLLHSHWATFAGLVLGIISGMVTVIRMAMNAMNDLSKRDGQ